MRPVEDPVLEQLGFDPRSDYVEQFWVSVLGPSAFLLLRRLAAQLESEPDGFDMDLVQWALELGLGTRGGKHSPVWRTLDRVCRFGLAQRNGEHISVKRKLPPLSLRQVGRLPDHLQAAHREWRERSLTEDRAA